MSESTLSHSVKRNFTCVTLINMAPMRIQAMRTPAGPPLCRALPEPTKRPVPMLPPSKRIRRIYKEKIRYRRTDSDHLKMSRLHLLLEHGRIRLQVGKILDIVSTSNDLSTKDDPSISSVASKNRLNTHPVVPGARLKLSNDNPRRVHTVSFEGS